jgi:hypothetical protein
MKRLMIAAFVAVIGLSLMVPQAEAKRLGGGSSIGMKRQATPAPSAVASSTPAIAATSAPATTSTAPAGPTVVSTAPTTGLRQGVGNGSEASIHHERTGGEGASRATSNLTGPQSARQLPKPDASRGAPSPAQSARLGC